MAKSHTMIHKHTYLIYDYDKPHDPTGSIEILALSSILTNVELLVRTNPLIREAFCEALALEDDDDEGGFSLAEILRDLFNSDVRGAVGIMPLEDMFGLTYRFPLGTPRLFLSYDMAMALSEVDISKKLGMHDFNLVANVGLTLLHELAHWIRAMLYGVESTPPGIVYPRTITSEWSPWFQNQAAEAGLAVEARIIGGLLYPIYRAGYEGEYTKIESFYLIREVNGVYYNSTAFGVDPLYIMKLAYVFLGRSDIPLHLVSLQINVAEDLTDVRQSKRHPDQWPNDCIMKEKDGGLWLEWQGIEIGCMLVGDIDEHVFNKCNTRDQ
ncbi:unnamed protein product [Somion occarium]|uniref:Uncharacterized protein n=1 Tax=Somion occarium TaxID=3059160 RepID=A0ABP1DRL8_9APHY